MADPQRAAARVVADYIAGMTDRFAGREYERLSQLVQMPQQAADNI